MHFLSLAFWKELIKMVSDIKKSPHILLEQTAPLQTLGKVAHTCYTKPKS